MRVRWGIERLDAGFDELFRHVGVWLWILVVATLPLMGNT